MIEENEFSKLTEELNQKKNRIGLVGTRLNVKQKEGKDLSAKISMDWKEIDITYGKELELVPDKETKVFIKNRKITDADKKVGEDLLEHEAGHRENLVGEGYGCPYDVETHDSIKDSITRGLNKIGKKNLEGYVTNAFEDVLDNINCRRHSDMAGVTLSWYNQGLLHPEKDGKFNPFYEAFVRINLTLGGKAEDYTLLRKFFSHDEKINQAVEGFLGKFVSTSGEKNALRMHEKKGFSRLFDDKDKRKEVWAQLGYEFAVQLGPLLKKMPEQKMFGSGNRNGSGNDKDSENRNGSEGDEEAEDRDRFDGDKESKSKNSSDEKKESENKNPFDSEMKMPWARQKIAKSRYEAGKEPAAHRDIQDQLYDLYKAISKEIPVETSHYHAHQSMPLVGFGRRFVKEDEQKFRFKGIGFKENGELGIKTTKHSIMHPVSYKTHPVKLPKLKVAKVDRSGSMALSPDNTDDIGSTSFIPWGNKSKIHFAIKGYFGIDNFFERQGVSGYIDNCVLGFSGEKTVRGKADKVARSLLTRPSGGTSLDINGLEKELEKDALLLSISDGELSINEKEKERFERKISSCDYAHIQIGGETDFSAYLKSIGVSVIYVKGDEDLSNAMVSFVSSRYRNIPSLGERK